MIPPAEIQRTSALLGVSPDVVEHDYALGCFLHFLGGLPEIGRSWVFKGGTSLAKCHFARYRFSEDLDFTLIEKIQHDDLGRLLDVAKARAQSEAGLRMDVRPTGVEVIEDDYGKQSYEAKVYHGGVWRPRGSPRAIRVHANRDETLHFPVLSLRVRHAYSDAEELPAVKLSVYALEEIVVEKLRALAGQRKYAVARDLYDVWSLDRAGVNVVRVLEALPEKCAAKGIVLDRTGIERLEADREEYKLNWRNNLEYLIPGDLRCPFDEAWDVSLGLLARAVKA